MRANEQGRSVASRLLAVFEAFESHGPSLSLSQIAELTGLPVSTAHRIVGELHAWGGLSRDAQGRYQIGMRLWELGQNASRRQRDTARPFLQDLFSLTGETVHLAVREGNEALYVDRIYGSKRVPRASRIGGRLPLHATAVGKVLLAYEEPWFREAYLAGELRALTPATHVDPVALARELAEIAEHGYAITGEEARAGACSIAVPVGSGSGVNAVEAAIGLVTLASQMPTLARHVPVLTGVARRIEAAIQHRPPLPLRP
ncbi:IclR family transcriptional regulator [Leucobacter soli]|uniref:IclR family transcriptional regulator n=1 Tax=Leucobacter soli TaxID=2812850 RepID=A0A916JZ35_9MICO|nr:IclR family transcriptional regulator [Leucobacter soli]CAG7611901.1 hypothetical protein LEUCIP111803_01499 [Leucobacter soli]